MIAGMISFKLPEGRKYGLIGVIAGFWIAVLMFCVPMPEWLFRSIVWIVPNVLLLWGIHRSQGFLSRALSCRLLVILGDCSANMYLIHQVVYGYFFYYGLMEGPAGRRIAVMLLNYVLTFVLAAGFQILMKRWAERKKYIKKWRIEKMLYEEVLANARTCMGEYCKACPVCNGKACRNQIPGPGAKGSGTVAIRNYDKWQEICLNMDTICENQPVSTAFGLFGQQFAAPIFAAPIGAMKLHYGDKYDDLQYNDILVSACADAGIAAFTGDGTNPAVMEAATRAIGQKGGKGIPTVKPWDINTLKEKFSWLRKAVHSRRRWI